MLTWASAQDYRQPGYLSDVQNAWPTQRGFVSAGQILNDAPSAVFSTVPSNGVSAIKTDGTYVGFVSCPEFPARIRNYLSGSDFSKAGGYSNGTTFFFAPMAAVCYATNGVDPLQKISLATLGNFADVPNCPRFKILVPLGSRLVGFNTTANITYAPTTYNASGSRYWYSAVGVFEDFAPTGAPDGPATDTLDDQDGEITAAIEFNNSVLVFKRSAIYLLEDEGTFITERKIHSEYGCEGMFAVCKCDNRIYFLSPSNGGEICMYDGNTVRALSREVLSNVFIGKRSVISNDSGGTTSISPLSYRDNFAATNGRYVAFLQSENQGPQNRANLIVFDTLTGRFGRSVYFASFLTSQGTCPFALWTSAENRNLVCAYVDAVDSLAKVGVISRTNPPPTNPTTFTLYRERSGGNITLSNSGKAYFLGGVPATGSGVSLVAEFPSAVVNPTLLQSDGRWSIPNTTAMRHTYIFSFTQPHEITDIKINIVGAGTDQSKPKGTM